MSKISNHSIERMKNILIKLPLNLGSTIKAHRNRLKISREKLSELSKISMKTIERIKTGK